MRAQLINENIEFKRGIGSKEALSVGKAGNPLIIANFQEEFTDDGPILQASDLPEDGNSWDNEVESDEAHHILANWKEYAHKYHSALVMRADNDDDELEHALAPELEGEYVQYEGKTYYIPETGMMAESVNFKRNRNTRKSLKVGEHRPFEIGDSFEVLKDLIWQDQPGGEWKESDSDLNKNIITGDVFEITKEYEMDNEWVVAKVQNLKSTKVGNLAADFFLDKIYKSFQDSQN